MLAISICLSDEFLKGRLRDKLYLPHYNQEYRKFVYMNNNHPWHAVSTGKNAPVVVTSIIEIPAGSKAKYEFDKETGLLRLDRVLYSSVHYPANYGFIPQTYCDDKDPLDLIVLSQVPLVPSCLVEAKVIGAIQMIDQGEHDDKIIAVAANDMSVSHHQDISCLPDHLLLELRGFFEDYKKLEHKTVSVDKIVGREEAYRIIRESIQLYKDTFLAKSHLAAV
jgi:inorganic pyrophosphatase